jgi:ligand-binding SRPBCC domain-containing protein
LHPGDPVLSVGATHHTPIMIHTLSQEQFLPITLQEAWEFFSHPKNLDEMTPEELGFRIIYQPGEEMYEGQIIEYRVMIFPGVWVPWVTEIKSVIENRSFIDEQRFGPYGFWHHLHHFEEVEGGVLMKDLVHYAMPFWPFGELGHGLFVRPKLERIFNFRREILDKRFRK